MTHVSTAMLVRHTKRSTSAVIDAIKRNKVPFENLGGRAGIRVAIKDANRLVQRQWPECGPIDPSKLILTRSTEK